MPEITEIIETCKYRPNGEQGDLDNCFGGVHWSGQRRENREGLCPQHKLKVVSEIIEKLKPRNHYFQPKIDFMTFVNQNVQVNKMRMDFGQFWDFLKDEKIGHLFFGGIKGFPSKMSAALSVFAYILFYHAKNPSKLMSQGRIGILYESTLKDAFVTRNYFTDGGAKGWPIREGGFYIVFNQLNCQLSQREEAQRNEMWGQILNTARVAIGVNIYTELQNRLADNLMVPVIHGPYAGVL